MQYASYKTSSRERAFDHIANKLNKKQLLTREKFVLNHRDVGSGMPPNDEHKFSISHSCALLRSISNNSRKSSLAKASLLRGTAI